MKTKNPRKVRVHFLLSREISEERRKGRVSEKQNLEVLGGKCIYIGIDGNKSKRKSKLKLMGMRKKMEYTE